MSRRWTPFEHPPGEERYWQIGSLRPWVFRSDHEWRVAYDREGGEPEDMVSIAAHPAQGSAS